MVETWCRSSYTMSSFMNQEAHGDVMYFLTDCLRSFSDTDNGASFLPSGGFVRNTSSQ